MADKILENVDSSRRNFLRRVLGAGFAIPVVATFSIAALTTDTAYAQISNQTACANQFPGEYLFAEFFEEASDPACEAPPPPVG